MQSAAIEEIPDTSATPVANAAAIITRVRMLMNLPFLCLGNLIYALLVMGILTQITK